MDLQKSQFGEYPYAAGEPSFDPGGLERGVYMMSPDDVRPFMHVERDPELGGRGGGGFFPEYLDKWMPGHGIELSEDQTAPTQEQHMDGLTQSVASVGWRHPAHMRPDSASPRGWSIGEGNHRIGVARRLGVPVPVAVGYESLMDSERDWNDRRNIRELPQGGADER